MYPTLKSFPYFLSQFNRAPETLGGRLAGAACCISGVLGAYCDILVQQYECYSYNVCTSTVIKFLLCLKIIFNKILFYRRLTGVLCLFARLSLPEVQ